MTSWPLVTLDEVFEIARGGSPRPIDSYFTDDPGGINWVLIGDASDSSKYITKTRKRIRQEGASKSRIVNPGDFLLSNSMSFGKPYIMGTSGCIHDGWLVLTKRRDNVDSDFFYHLLGSGSVYREFVRRAAGATVKNLNIELVKGVKIPLPPIAEQRRIAAILDKAEALRTKRSQALAKLDTLTQSLFLEMFGDPWHNSKGWRMDRFGNVGVLDRGISKHRPRNAPELLGGLYPLIQTGEITNCDGFIRAYENTYSELGLRQSRLWPAGTLCITIAANIARTGILAFAACFPDSVVGFKPGDAVATEYVQTWLSFLQKYLEDTAPAFAQKNINLAILRDLPIPVPPKALQEDFCQRMDRIDGLKTSLAASEAKIDTVFASLQHQAFQGDL